MKRLFLLLTLLPTPVLAQQPFVPFVVTEKDAKELRTWLDEQPLKFALPILQWIDTKEKAAIAQNAKPEEEKK